VPLDSSSRVSGGTDLAHDPLYRAPALGRSETGDLADRHDDILYGDEG
jgi:hypothetical protein